MVFIFFGGTFCPIRRERKPVAGGPGRDCWLAGAREAVVDRYGEMQGDYLVRISLLSLVMRSV